jgi:alanyl-tRNA synthetase
MYYEQPYLQSLEATVVSITDAGVILDKTICYPEGGGQSGNIGFLGSSVLEDTTKDHEGTIYHHVTDPGFAEGDTVTITLDWGHRYQFMQMHTAQHIASGLLYSHFGIGTTSVHQGQEIMTIETDASHIPLETCYALEDLVNAAVLEAHPIRYEVHTQASAQSLDLRRSIKVEGDGVRLVIIEGVDTIACGGLHVANTREVQLFHYQGQEKMRGHIRLLFTVADAARKAIRKAEQVGEELGVMFSSPLDTLSETAFQALAAAGRDKAALQKARQTIASLLLSQKVEKADPISGIPLVLWLVGEELALKEIGQAVTEYQDLALCAVKQDGERVMWLVALQGKGASLVDFSRIKSSLLEPIQGKGGGRPPLYQGSGSGDGLTLLDSFARLVR